MSSDLIEATTNKEMKAYTSPIRDAVYSCPHALQCGDQRFGALWIDFEGGVHCFFVAHDVDVDVDVETRYGIFSLSHWPDSATCDQDRAADGVVNPVLKIFMPENSGLTALG